MRNDKTRGLNQDRADQNLHFYQVPSDSQAHEDVLGHSHQSQHKLEHGNHPFFHQPHTNFPSQHGLFAQ